MFTTSQVVLIVLVSIVFWELSAFVSCKILKYISTKINGEKSAKDSSRK